MAFDLHYIFSPYIKDPIIQIYCDEIINCLDNCSCYNKKKTTENNPLQTITIYPKNNPNSKNSIKIIFPPTVLHNKEKKMY